MSTVAEPRASASSHSAIGDLSTRGYHMLPRALSPTEAEGLLAAIRELRHFDESLFLTESEFDANPVYRGVNPRPGRNLLERFEDMLAFVEKDPLVVETMTAVLGDGYRILDRKLVCGVPSRSVPAWLKARILGNPVNNLGAYVRPEFRDVTYFFGIDFHQDVIDWPDRPADMITLYVYPHAVTAKDAPLYLLEGSQALGATEFPHQLQKLENGLWRYAAPGRGSIDCRQITLTGGTGFAAMWHGCVLHGTQPDVADEERISVRYLLTRGTAAECGLDSVNASIGWPVMLKTTRADLDASGKAKIKHNAVNEA